MSHVIRFARPCPHCGRMLEVSLQSIGRNVTCFHCSNMFVADLASDSQDEQRWMDDKIDRLLDAAERHVARFSLTTARYDFQQEAGCQLNR